MIRLAAQGAAHGFTRDVIGRVALTAVPEPGRQDAVRVISSYSDTEDLRGYAAVVHSNDSAPTNLDIPHLSNCQTNHLSDRDIVLINRRGYMRTVIRHGSPSNSLFATDRCNSLCLMCSQPPKEGDDSGKVAELVRIVQLMDAETASVGITGGEPTLLGDGLLDVIRACRDYLPRTSLHLLSNGLWFWYPSYARALSDIKHPDLMVGIPLYADVDTLHDYVVQAKGAFEETLIGLQNLGQCSVPVEIRIVIQRHTATRLVELAQFIYRNLTFAAHVTFMGLEITGYAKGNLDDLWIAPEEYTAQLETAVRHLSAGGMTVSIYNHQLCRVPRSLWPFCRQSISDWKNDYAAACDPCSVKQQCGGFFSWNLAQQRANAVYPIATTGLAREEV